MIDRYSTTEMRRIWSDEQKFKTWLDVELAALWAFEEVGIVSKGIAHKLDKKRTDIDWNGFIKRQKETEEITKHDVIAFLNILEEDLGDDARHIHLGMTSSDVVDTAFAILLQRSGTQIKGRLAILVKSLRALANKHKLTPCLGRSHGQAAEVTSFGIKILSHVAEVERNIGRMARAVEEISYGKLSGAVGNFGSLDPRAEAIAMKRLGLRSEPISTQIVPRDRHAYFFSTLAIVGGGLERLAVEIRHLMRSEVSEVFEPFAKGQKGSSAMPHKRNPIQSENVTGLSRLLRSYAQAAMEDQALWHERDISHSSVERVIAPDATCILDFAISRMISVIDGLEIDETQMLKHLEDTKGLIYSEAVLLELIKAGLKRQDAYILVQNASMKTRTSQESFLENVLQDVEITKHINVQVLKDLFTPSHQLRYADAIFARMDVLPA